MIMFTQVADRPSVWCVIAAGASVAGIVLQFVR